MSFIPYTMSAKPVEYFNLPQDEGIFKIVQIYHGDAPILVFPKKTPNHRAALRDFLEERGIPYTVRPLEGTPLHIPDLQGAHYTVVGMGLLGISARERHFGEPHGASADYFLSTDPTFNALMKNTPPQGWMYAENYRPA